MVILGSLELFGWGGDERWDGKRERARTSKKTGVRT
jgi:hypothetical protein